MEQSPIDDLIDVDEVCKIVGGNRPVVRQTIWKMVKRGALPKPVPVGPQLRRWRRSEIYEALAQRAAERDRAAA